MCVTKSIYLLYTLGVTLEVKDHHITEKINLVRSRMEEYLPLLVWPLVGRQDKEWQVIFWPFKLVHVIL